MGKGMPHITLHMVIYVNLAYKNAFVPLESPRMVNGLLWCTMVITHPSFHIKPMKLAVNNPKGLKPNGCSKGVAHQFPGPTLILIY